MSGKVSNKSNNSPRNVRIVEQEYLKIAELAVYSGISERTLWDLIKSPIDPIPHFRVGPSGKLVRVKKSEFDQWMESQRATISYDIDGLIADLLK